MKKRNHEKYAMLIAGAISSIFDKDSEFYIPENELHDNKNLTDFIHAVANLVPAMIHNDFTGTKLNPLEFNHLANKLCFQYTHLEIESNNGLIMDKNRSESLYRIIVGLSTSCYENAEVDSEAKEGMKEVFEKIKEWGESNCDDLRGEKLKKS